MRESTTQPASYVSSLVTGLWLKQTPLFFQPYVTTSNRGSNSRNQINHLLQNTHIQVLASNASICGETYFYLHLYLTWAHFIRTILNGSCVCSIQILTSELTGRGLEFPKCQENEQLLCSSRAQTWEHSYYLGELRKNSWHPAVWPLHDFIHPGVSVKHQANSSFRKQSISQNIQTTLHNRGFTPGRLGVGVGGKRRKCMNGKYSKRRWMSMSQVGSDKKNYTPCHDWDSSLSAVHQDQRQTEHCRALSASLSFLSL